MVVSLLLFGVGTTLDRSQAAVDDTAFMKGMIPHHSLAITRSERFTNDDVRVCELAVAISEAQRREILEMDWLIADIAENGPATTPEEADARAVPDFDRPAERQCPTGRRSGSGRPADGTGRCLDEVLTRILLRLDRWPAPSVASCRSEKERR